MEKLIAAGAEALKENWFWSELSESTRRGITKAVLEAVLEPKGCVDITELRKGLHLEGLEIEQESWGNQVRTYADGIDITADMEQWALENTKTKYEVKEELS